MRTDRIGAAIDELQKGCSRDQIVAAMRRLDKNEQRQLVEYMANAVVKLGFKSRRSVNAIRARARARARASASKKQTAGAA